MNINFSSGRQRRRAAIVLVLMAALLIAPDALALGAGFGWARNMGGTSYDEGRAIALDGSGNVYTTGYFEGTVDFDPGPSTFNLTSAGNSDIFVSKMDSNGNLLWARGMGGTGYDYGRAIALDGSGNVYITGWFWSIADFDPGPGATNLTSAGASDIFVSKMDSNGNLLWARGMGGTGYDYSRAIALDGSGNVYTTGEFSGTVDFDPGPGTFNLTSAGNSHIFVSKMDSDGNLLWARGMGGTDYDGGSAIALDGSGNVYITGYFRGTADFDPGPGTFNLTSTGEDDIFVSKLSSSGDFAWAKRMGGNSYDEGSAIAVDEGGNVYTTGWFRGLADFDPEPGVNHLFLQNSAGESDIFISKLSSSGDFVWANRMGGSDYDIGLGIALDGSGNVYITGYFRGTADFDPGPGTTNLTSTGEGDIFVSKLSSSGDFAWAKAMGGTGYGYGRAIALDGSGNAYTTGDFEGTADFDPGPGIANLTSVGQTDIFVSKLLDEKSTTLRSQANYDGWMLESSETSNVGGAKDNLGKVLYVGDDASNRQYRAILSFNTSGIPASANITRVTLRLKKSSVVGGGNPIKTFRGILVDIKKGNFGKASLALGDFQAKPGKTYGPFKPSLSGGWYSIDLTSGQTFINRSGNTQIRLCFKLGDNNNSVANYLKLYSGNAPTASRPQLIVEYTIP